MRSISATMLRTAWRTLAGLTPARTPRGEWFQLYVHKIAGAAVRRRALRPGRFRRSLSRRAPT
jgi:hypothetical protein